MRRVQAILFDLDGTLLDYDDAAWMSTVDEVCSGLDGVGEPGRLSATYTRMCYRYWQAAERQVGRDRPGATVRRHHRLR
jgi:FMN phosphatase YigB (HAD superfamily)